MGYLYVISGASGSGKTTVVGGILKKEPSILYSISCTTRPPRPGEVEGKSYFFISESEFKKRISKGYFLEYARVFGNYYGTPAEFIKKNVKYKNIILDVDVQGAMQIKNKLENSRLIFLYTDFLEIRRRLIKRNEKDIEKRLKKINYEMGFIKYYDYIVRNDRLEYAIDSILSIIKNDSQ